MSAKNKNKYRFDLYVQRDNALSIIDFCKSNGISVNSMINHLIVSFLLNRDKYVFNFVNSVSDKSSQGIRSIENNGNTNDDDGDCLPDILKQLLDDNNNDSLEYDF